MLINIERHFEWIFEFNNDNRSESEFQFWKQRNRKGNINYMDMDSDDSMSGRVGVLLFFAIHKRQGITKKQICRLRHAATLCVSMFLRISIWFNLLSCHFKKTNVFSRFYFNSRNNNKNNNNIMFQ